LSSRKQASREYCKLIPKPYTKIFCYAQWLLEGRLPLTVLVSLEYRLEQVNDALADLEQGRVARAPRKLAA
jgi:Zn-dependent alcohol dehydrogenase